MKHLFFILSITILFTSCRNDSEICNENDKIRVFKMNHEMLGLVLDTNNLEKIWSIDSLIKSDLPINDTFTVRFKYKNYLAKYRNFFDLDVKSFTPYCHVIKVDRFIYKIYIDSRFYKNFIHFGFALKVNKKYILHLYNKTFDSNYSVFGQKSTIHFASETRKVKR